MEEAGRQPSDEKHEEITVMEQKNCDVVWCGVKVARAQNKNKKGVPKSGTKQQNKKTSPQF